MAERYASMMKDNPQVARFVACAPTPTAGHCQPTWAASGGRPRPVANSRSTDVPILPGVLLAGALGAAVAGPSSLAPTPAPTVAVEHRSVPRDRAASESVAPAAVAAADGRKRSRCLGRCPTIPAAPDPFDFTVGAVPSEPQQEDAMPPVSTLTRRATLAAAALLASPGVAARENRPKPPPLVSAQAVATDVSVPIEGGIGFIVTAKVVSFRLADDSPDFAVQTFTVFVPGALPAAARRARILGHSGSSSAAGSASIRTGSRSRLPKRPLVRWSEDCIDS
jgi:hypothetical protein